MGDVFLVVYVTEWDAVALQDVFWGVFVEYTQEGGDCLPGVGGAVQEELPVVCCGGVVSVGSVRVQCAPCGADAVGGGDGGDGGVCGAGCCDGAGEEAGLPQGLGEQDLDEEGSRVAVQDVAGDGFHVFLHAAGGEGVLRPDVRRGEGGGTLCHGADDVDAVGFAQVEEFLCEPGEGVWGEEVVFAGEAAGFFDGDDDVYHNAGVLSVSVLFSVVRR